MKKTSSNINIDELSVKDAFIIDIGSLLSKGSVFTDPAPMLFVPIAPIVVGKKIINRAKKIADSIKK